MDIKEVVVELGTEELRIFCFALKRQLINTIDGHIKNLQDTYNEGNPYRRRIFFEQNKDNLELLKKIDVFNYGLRGEVIFHLDKLFPNTDNSENKNEGK